MAITTQAGLAAAKRQRHSWFAGMSANTMSSFDLSSAPGAGTLAGSSTTAGVIPTAATPGTMTPHPFGAGKTGYLTKFENYLQRSQTAYLYDLLWKAGAYAFNAAVSLSGQPALQRVPNTDYKPLQLIVEIVTTFTGNPVIDIGYLDAAGNPQTTSITLTAPVIRSVWRLPLITEGIQQVTSVTATVASAGTFNVLIVRRVGFSGIGDVTNNQVGVSSKQVDTPLLTGMALIDEDAALAIYVNAVAIGGNTGAELEFAVG